MEAALIGALAGALAGAVASFWLNSIQDWWRVRRTSKKLRFVPEDTAGTRVTARLVNNSIYPIRGAIAYISLAHTEDDVMDPPLHFSAFVSAKHLRMVREDRLCWSATSPVRNPMAIDNYAGEYQSLDILDLGAERRWIEIPSEQGYSSSQTAEQAREEGAISSRVFLRSNQKYRGYVRIVSGDTRSNGFCKFSVEIDPSNHRRPVRLI